MSNSRPIEGKEPRPSAIESRQWATWAWNLGVTILLLVASVWVWRTIRVNQQLRSALQMMTPQHERASMRDRLLGFEIPQSFLREVVGAPQRDPDGSESRLLWIVDTERCKTCLTDGFAIWNALAEAPSVSRHLLVLGDGKVPEVARRILRGTSIGTVSRERAAAILGPLLPNTKILVDRTGVILMFDSRRTGSKCGWNFDAQVGALQGILAGRIIRNQPKGESEWTGS